MNKTKNNAGFLGAVEFFLFMLLVAFIVIVVHTCQDFSLESAVHEDIADVNNFKAAMQAFKTKYGQLPGDYAAAKSSWSEAANGNGNGFWDSGEGVEAFKQLAFADMVEINEDALFPKLASTKQSLFPIGNFNKEAGALMSDIFSGYEFPSNSFMFYFENAAMGNMMPVQQRVPHEAVYIYDNKVDDGNGVTGNVRAAFRNPDFFGISSVKELCVYSNGKYRTDENDDLYCNFIVKY